MADDGIIFMNIKDYKNMFDATTINYDITGWHQASFMRLNDNDNRPGELSECGSKCTRHVVNFTSTVDQNLYIAAHLWDNRGHGAGCSS